MAPQGCQERGPRCLAVELKAEKGKLTEEQILWLDAFAEAGVHTEVWHPSMWADIERLLT